MDLPSSFTLTLTKAVVFNGREYTELVLQEPTAKMVLQAEEQLRNGATVPALRNREIHLVASAAGVPVPVIEQIKIGDLIRGMAYIAPFLNIGPETGGN